ncbi:hypothetical protein ASF28_15375 [Methylobacterium sp. Leaf99]|nr:hypothetical protein ASF28_15375 [Methylobacterium sp. Leaf99]
MPCLADRNHSERRPAIVTRCFALALCVVLATPASAQTTGRMTCADAMALVKRQGAILLDTGNQTFQRFVRDRSFCEITEIADLRFVPTRDNPECPIGYRCREPDYGDWDWQ